MDYKYQRRQIFGKRLKVPKHILNEVYNCTLYFNEFIEYQLDDKIPTSCIIESDRKIVEKFGIEKCKGLDWELINKRIFDNNISVRNILMSIDSQAEDINHALYELVKDQIRPSDYSPRMSEIYSDRLFEITQDDDDNLKYAKRRFNYGKVSLDDLVYNWDLYKDKDLSYCLKNDKHNEFNVTDQQVKDFMDKFGNISRLIIANTDIYQFIHEINSSKSTQEKQEYIKQITDSILEKDIMRKKQRKDNLLDNYTWNNEYQEVFELSNAEYKELFKYSSIQDYLKRLISIVEMI